MLLGGIYCMIDLIETKGKEKEQILIEMKVMEPNRIQPDENDSLQDQSNDYDKMEIGQRNIFGSTIIRNDDPEQDDRNSDANVVKGDNYATKQDLDKDISENIDRKDEGDASIIRPEA